ncbi:helix-turn-helix domain-containing protein, partial [Rhizobium brockwellii]
IARLRKKLGGERLETMRGRLETVRGRGYMLTAAVAP